jgi:uncharacterized protein (UPF0332 family)
MDINECIEKGFLKRIERNDKMIKKEIESSIYDLKRSEQSFEFDDYKWATIKAYYSIFHAAKALIISKGYIEKKHFAIGVVLEYLATIKQIDYKIVTDFHAALGSREDADYRHIYSKETSEYIIEIAKEFIPIIKKILRL